MSIASLVCDAPIMTDRKSTLKSAKAPPPAKPRGGRALHAFTGARNFMRKRTGPPRSVEDRREALILLAIALLFVANVVVYLCHHWNLTSANDLQPRRPVAPRVIID